LSDEVKAAILTHFEAKYIKYFFDGIHKLIQRYDKCVRLKGKYIGKEK
jgi:hypothetical protein